MNERLEKINKDLFIASRNRDITYKTLQVLKKLKIKKFVKSFKKEYTTNNKSLAYIHINFYGEGYIYANDNSDYEGKNDTIIELNWSEIKLNDILDLEHFLENLIKEELKQHLIERFNYIQRMNISENPDNDHYYLIGLTKKNRLKIL